MHVVLLALLLVPAGSYAQYIHPNQAGQKGGNTITPGTGSQVVTSTYLGNIGGTGQGTIFVSDKDGTNKFAVHEFQGYPSDGSYPFYTTPHQASDGNLYGASYVGGSSNWGAVYKYATGSCGNSVVYSNSPGEGSAGNYANVNELSDGKIYAAMSYGAGGHGAIVRMDKDGSNVQNIHIFKYTLQTVAYTPGAIANSGAYAATLANPVYRYDGAYPYGFVVEGADGKIYGTTYAGGYGNQGTVYRMDKDGANYEIIQVLNNGYRAFNNATSGAPGTSVYGPATPYGNVAQDQNGRIYLTTYSGGAGNIGGIWSFNADGTDTRILKSGSSADGSRFYRGPLVLGNAVYGTSYIGGAHAYGTVWKWDITTSTYTILHSFDVSDGYWAWAGLSYDGTYLYGTTIAGGGAGKVGTLYKIKPDGTNFTVLHRFSNTAGPADCGPGKAGLYSYYASCERVTFANISPVNCSLTCIEDPASATVETNPDIATSIINKPISGNVSTNDNVPAGTAYGPPMAGTGNPTTDVPAMNSDGSYTFTPTVPGTYTFDVPVCPPGQTTGCPTESLTITVVDPSADDNLPIVNDDQASASEGNLVTIAVLGNDAPGNEGGTLGTPTVPSQPANGTAVVNSDGTITYTPDPGFTGTDEFTYEVCETPSGLCKTATVSVEVLPAGSPNSVNIEDDVFTTTESSPVSGSVLANDTDPQGDNLTVSTVDLGSGPVPPDGTPQTVLDANGDPAGTITFNPDGTFTFDPAPDFTGTVSIPYTACDNGSPIACGSATLEIVVKPDADTPDGPADLSPELNIAALSFAADGEERDFIVNLYELLGGQAKSSVQLIQFTINRPSAFDITVPGLTLSGTNQAGVAGTANIGGDVITYENENWLFRQTAGFIIVTAKDTNVNIDGLGQASLGFKVKRKAGIASNTSQNIVVTIIAGSGGETNIENNTSYTVMVAN